MRATASYVAAETGGQRLGTVMAGGEVSGRHWVALACCTIGLDQRSRAGLNLQRNKRLASVRDICSCTAVHMDLALTTMWATLGVERRPVSCRN
jgi:hypothetical protein